MASSILLMILTILVSSTVYGATSRDDDFFKSSLVAAKHEQWMARFDRVYATQSEKQRRFQIFKKKLEFVENFNKNKNTTYKLGINQFSDLTDEEFRARFTGLSPPEGINRISRPGSYGTSTFRYANVTDADESIDWRERGAVTPVKSQGQCGVCWAFAAIATVEGINKIANDKFVALSEQQVISCEPKKSGCLQGGNPEQAYEFIINASGVASEEDYPYQAYPDGCLYPDLPRAASISGYEYVPRNNEIELMKAVSRQPIAVSVDSSFRDYESGVYDGPCGTNIDHAVAIVGYGHAEDGTKYWLVKNSWSKEWGENGFIRIRRDVGVPEGKCGVAMYPTYPVTK